jgi:hypothetical protein
VVEVAEVLREAEVGKAEVVEGGLLSEAMATNVVLGEVAPRTHAQETLAVECHELPSLLLKTLRLRTRK